MKVVKSSTEKKVNKITKEQLDTILLLQKESSSVIHNIGLLEAEKHNLLHNLSNINSRSEEFKNQLQRDYGDIKINIQDGSYDVITKDKE